MPLDEQALSPGQGDHAVVIGASIAGCLAARVLADRFRRVTLLERHPVPDGPEPRKGVPQENHVHLLLCRGKLILDELFPGFLAELESGGAVVADLSSDLRWFQYGVWRERFDSGVAAHYCSRGLIDSVIRARLRRLRNLELLAGAEVLEPIASPDGRGIRGVRWARGEQQHTLDADLVVDASGRGSKTSVWLKNLGYPTVERSVVATDLGYATQLYERRPEFHDQWKVMLVLPRPPRSRRMGVISPIEGNRWMVTTGGWFGEFPSADQHDYLEFLRSLPAPDIYQVIKDARPVSPIVTYRMKGGLRRHYERMARWPEGLVVVGDALCSLNPLYSQGMSVCAMEAQALQRALRPRSLAGRPLPFNAHQTQKAIARAVEPSWAMAESEDLRFPETTGERPLKLRLRHWYGAQVVLASAHDRQVRGALLRAINLLEGGTHLHSPGIVARVMGRWARSLVFKNHREELSDVAPAA
jgi:2-polyprenyl-6-methoxyphenol hydroxylase-like FAD-dependent oxidoreductase